MFYPPPADASNEPPAGEGLTKYFSKDPHYIPYRGRLFHFFWPLTRYVITNTCAVLAWVYLYILNKTVVIGKQNASQEPNTLLLPNHQTMLDGFLVGVAAFYPKCFIKPSLFPWIPAAYENFYNNPFLAWFSDNWKCIPIRLGRKDYAAMRRMVRCLPGGHMIIFPEGTRSRDGRILPPRLGTGYLICETRPRVIPVCMDGMDKVLPVGSKAPRIGRTVFLYFGKPVDLARFYDLAPCRETYEAIMNEIFIQIKRQHGILTRYRRYRRHLTAKKPFWRRLYAP
ncbi:MAG: 1-acyl-sn-glycerol-3-phosphate acyltransferase [Elusimicrobia bacterium]|nr:1-acyl-sn-glycerol-3-phosphate acyltransferase [Elusimicrobiota bacterium]